MQWWTDNCSDRMATWRKNYTDLWTLRVASIWKLGVLSWHPAFSECITPLALSIFSICMHFCSYTGAKQSQFNCISSLPCQNKRNTSNTMHCINLYYFWKQIRITIAKSWPHSQVSFITPYPSTGNHLVCVVRACDLISLTIPALSLSSWILFHYVQIQARFRSSEC